MFRPMKRFKPDRLSPFVIFIALIIVFWMLGTNYFVINNAAGPGHASFSQLEITAVFNHGDSNYTQSGLSTGKGQRKGGAQASAHHPSDAAAKRGEGP